jgi:hypothetical protein
VAEEVVHADGLGGFSALFQRFNEGIHSCIFSRTKEVAEIYSFFNIYPVKSLFLPTNLRGNYA